MSDIKKCDICGKEIKKYTSHFKLIQEFTVYSVKWDVCADCIERIKNEIKCKNISK